MSTIEDTVNKIYTKVAVQEEILERVEAHVKATNGTVAQLTANQLRQEGALSVIKLVGSIFVGAIATGASIAGVVEILTRV